MANLDSVQLHYIESSAEAAAFIEWCKQNRHTMAIDTETTGLERDARIRLIQFGDADQAWTLRWDQWKGPALEALALLKRGRQPLTFHNAPYDVPKIEVQSAADGDGFKFDWGLIDDTMIMSRLASPIGGHGLKSLATKYVDKRAQAMQAVLSDAMDANKWTWETVPYSYEGYTVYAGIDCILTARLLPELEKLDYNEDLYRTEMTTLEACVYMSQTGLLVDAEYCMQQINMLEQELEELIQMGKDKHHFHQFGSNQMLVEKLHNYGCTWDERTDAGRVAVDGDVLERLVVEASHPAARDLARLALAHRTRIRLMNTYFRNMIRGADGDGRVHPDINTLEAVTGRMTVKGYPAMQTLPRGPRVRRGFVASPDTYLILADYSQIEIRILAHFCKDPALLEAIATGDVHTASAAMIFGDGNVTPQRRQLSKSSVLSKIYGAGPEKFSHTAGVSVEQGTDFLEAYDRKFTKVKPWTQKVQQVGRERERSGHGAYVLTPAGRRLQMRKSDAHYTLVNYLCQGTAADIFKQAIARLWETEFGSMLRLPVHDECVFEVPKHLDPEEVKKEITNVMEDFSLNVPLTVEATGPFQNWAEKYGET